MTQEKDGEKCNWGIYIDNPTQRHPIQHQQKISQRNTTQQFLYQNTLFLLKFLKLGFLWWFQLGLHSNPLCIIIIIAVVSNLLL